MKQQRSPGAGLKAFYVRQFKSLIWMLLALGLGLTLREIVPWLNQRIDPATMALISGLAGIIGPNMAQFARAGGVITRNENPRTNMLVGAGTTLLALLFFSWFFGALLN